MTALRSSALFEAVYKNERGRLLRYFRRKVGPDVAPDLVQEAFTRLLHSKALERIENPTAYLTRIAQNLLIERWRRLAREQSVFLPFDEGRDAPVCAEQEFRIEAMELRRAMAQALRAMTPKTRRVFLMHRMRNLNHREIGEKLGITQQTVQYHIARALVRYRRVIALQG